jgi:hypothetical protein
MAGLAASIVIAAGCTRGSATHAAELTKRASRQSVATKVERMRLIVLETVYSYPQLYIKKSGRKMLKE